MTPETIDAMLAAGVTAEVIAAAWKSELVVQGRATEQRRSKERERQRRHRGSRNVTVTAGDTPLDDSISKPPENPKPNGLAPPKKSDRGTRLSADWLLPAEWAQWATERRKWSDAEIAEEALLFANYWHARSGAGASHRDWFKTWQNWVVRSHRKDGTAAAKLTRAEVRANLEGMIPLYERMGRDDDAAETRRRIAAIDAESKPRRRTTPIGQIANDIMRRTA